MKGKIGTEFTIGTLIVIVLAIIVLVVLVLGFGTGWSNLWSKITGYSGTENVDTIKQSCTMACTSVFQDDWCSKTRGIIYNDENNKKQNVDVTCESWSNGKDKSGNDLPVRLKNTKPDRCSAISCPA